MKSFSPREEQENKVKVLQNFCEHIGTCLKASVLNYDKIGDGKYIFGARFYKSDGSVFALGPCCTNEVSDESPTTEFNFCVEKINGAFKVINGPVYVP